MKKDIIGRKYEFELLDGAMSSAESELIIVYGRRRVGKTYLVNQYFSNQFAFKFTGVYNQPTAVQLERFASQIEEYSGTSHTAPENWFKAFDMLKHLLKAAPSEGKKVVFIDEMPWLDTTDSNFVAAFEQFWNGWASAEGNIVLIACGSATSWMTDTLLGHKGGLFNRSALRMYVRPFSLKETEEYLISRGVVWTRYDVALCYMIMGGIPFYLKQLQPRWSFAQNIDNIFFRERGLLWDEFTHLYNTLFKQPSNHVAVVEALATKKMGLTRKEIIQATKLNDNGNLTQILNNLINSEFIRPYRFFGNKKKDTIYQLTDFYTMFYFNYIKGNYGRDENFWANSVDNPSRRAWAGYTFEQLCLCHISQVRKAIGIGAVQCETSAWFHRGDENTKGAQIDLLIDRRDRVINICEAKFSVNEYAIDKDYVEALQRKMETFRTSTKTNKALQLTLITTQGLKHNKYSNCVQSTVTLDDLFS
ncbi:MAG: ATP-binding protein [Bacteroidales bacterium]|nr:ATP-binding protein [Bacteroidales bacterium]